MIRDDEQMMSPEEDILWERDALRQQVMELERTLKDQRERDQEYKRNPSERTSNRDKLTDAEKRFFEIMDQSTVGIFRTTIAGKILFANRVLVNILGYDSADELMTINAAVLNRRQMEGEKIVTRLRRDGKLSNYKTEMITKSGETKNIIISAFLENDIMSGIVTDETQHRLATEENRKLQSQLIRAQKMEALGTLAGGIAHDFNNILMGIQGNIDLALFQLEPDHPYHTRLELIRKLIRSGSELTGQLLGFARGGKYEIVTVDINSLLIRSSSLFNRTGKEIVIDMKLQEDVWAVDVDQGQIEQVFMNILINARQAMPEGGNLYIETKNVLRTEAELKPYRVPPGRYVRISFTDTGIGMDENILERIFDPFFTTKKLARGTGLGLASAYGIVKNHGGYITVKSSLGQGSIFTIDLPASANAATSIDEVDEKLMTGHETILVVDDEKNVVAVINEILASLGYRVFVAGSGQEAVAIYMEKKDIIDLIILDMIMPGMSGERTFEILREIYQEVKVILTSGYSLDEHTRCTLAHGCKGFLQKPFNMHEISQKIRDVLDG